MNISIKTSVLFLLIFGFKTVLAQQKEPVYKDPSQPVKARISDLMERMTPEEKFWQCFMIPGNLKDLETNDFSNGIFGLQINAIKNEESNQLLNYDTTEKLEDLAEMINRIQKYFVEESRLGIPIIPFDEALHGLVRGSATVFPQAIGLAASFNIELMEEVSSGIANEARLSGIRQVLSPVINLSTDPRWGRVEETYGEDPFLTTKMGTAFISAFEKNGIITTPKHFVANVGDGGRDSYPIHWSERYLEETHLIPFHKAFKNAGARSVMTAYNTVKGAPATASNWLLTEKLKEEWGFDGFVISDAAAVGGASVLLATAKNSQDATTQALKAGLDVIFQTEYNHYKLFSPPFLDGSIPQERIDDAVARVLKAKFELGLFEDPYVSKKEIEELKAIDHKKTAYKAAIESFVLLQNNRNTLPIADTFKNILVVGADAKEVRLGGYSGATEETVSILEGIRNKGKQDSKNIHYEKGITWDLKEFQVIPNKFLFQEGQNGLVGEYFANSLLEGSPTIQRIDNKVDFHWTLSSPDSKKLQKDNYSVKWKGELKAPATGEYKVGLRGNDGFRLYINGEKVIDRWEKLSYSTDKVEMKMQKDELYTILIEYKEERGNGHIELIWDYGLPDYQKDYNKALEAVKGADYIVITAGIHEGEFQDRASLSLPGNQEKFIKEAAKLGKPITVVLVGGSAIKTTNWKEDVGAILDVWYPGQEGGNAVADILFGKENPSGKLPITFPIEEGQLPLVYNHYPTGRGDDYYDLSGEPLYPFGFGLSYTSFEMSKLSINRDSYTKNDTITVKVEVTNTGAREGSEVIQVYVKDLLASVPRPVIELKGFEKVHLEPNESKIIAIDIPVSELSFLNKEKNWVVEPGTYRIMVGNSSRNLPLKKNIKIR